MGFESLTDFQKKVISCKPEIDKPVFIITGVGTGKTYALKERARFEKFLYYTPDKKAGDAYSIDFHTGCDVDPYDTVIFEYGNTLNYIDKIFDTIYNKKKKVIVSVTCHIFPLCFFNRLKGEYTIISGYDFKDCIDKYDTHYMEGFGKLFGSKLSGDQKCSMYYGKML